MPTVLNQQAEKSSLHTISPRFLDYYDPARAQTGHYATRFPPDQAVDQLLNYIVSQRGQNAAEAIARDLGVSIVDRAAVVYTDAVEAGIASTSLVQRLGLSRQQVRALQRRADMRGSTFADCIVTVAVERSPESFDAARRPINAEGYKWLGLIGAAEAHQGQLRNNGEPYWGHPAFVMRMIQLAGEGTLDSLLSRTGRKILIGGFHDGFEDNLLWNSNQIADCPTLPTPLALTKLGKLAAIPRPQSLGRTLFNMTRTQDLKKGGMQYNGSGSYVERGLSGLWVPGNAQAALVARESAEDFGDDKYVDNTDNQLDTEHPNNKRLNDNYPTCKAAIREAFKDDPQQLAFLDRIDGFTYADRQAYLSGLDFDAEAAANRVKFLYARALRQAA